MPSYDSPKDISAVTQDLIYDLGAHEGEDTEFYLRKGFRVVAVEANPSLADVIRRRFPSEIKSGKLHLVDAALAPTDGEIGFFVNDRKSVWGTIDNDWAERNRRMGSPSHQTTVAARRFESVIVDHGIPYYLKIDLEGMDMMCLSAVAKFSAKPQFVSIESNKASWQELLGEFELLKNIGYDKFKIINQSRITRQKEPRPALEGVRADHQFSAGSSGLFGKDLPGRWLTADEAISRYRRIFMKYKYFGDNTKLRRILKHVPFAGGIVGRQVGWYDTHAARS